MVEWQMKSDRKNTGGRRRTSRRSTKKLAWRGGIFSETKLSENESRVSVKGRGNSLKSQARHAMNINVFDPLTKKSAKAKILTIFENNANRQYARRNIITKGAVLEIELNGKKFAKVTSRPGQNGIISGVLTEVVEEKKKTQHKGKAKKPKEHKKKHAKKEDKKEESKKEEAKKEEKPVKEKISEEKKEEKDSKENKKEELTKEPKEEKKTEELKEDKKEPVKEETTDKTKPEEKTEDKK